MSNQDSFLPLSGIQHFAFCRRQWALIHIENLWAENVRTVEGNILHERAHDETQTESRGDVLILRGLRVASEALGFSGACDVVEFHRHPNGVPLQGREGLWLPYPVEYKRGSPKEDDCDQLQLCAQAMCLEEAFVCEIPEGSLYYGEIRRRQRVAFTPELRERVKRMAAEMRACYDRRHTPSARPSKACGACSLKDLCLPKLIKSESVGAYIHSHTKDDI